MKDHGHGNELTAAEHAFLEDPKLVSALEATADTSTATDGRPTRRSAEIEPTSSVEDATLVDLARDASMNGLTIRDIVNAAVARGIAEEVMGDEDDFAAALDAITEDAVVAVAKLVEIAINQQGLDAQFGMADWELVELIFQAPVMNMDRPEPEEETS